MTNLNIKIKKLNDKAVIPEYATEGSAGMDMVATSEKVVIDGACQYIEYGTGLAFELPPGYCMLLLPRSSISSKTSLILNNSIGLVDQDYSQEVKFRFKNIAPIGGRKYKVGEKIGQLVIIPYPKIVFEEVKEIAETTRTGGFGSTDK